MKNIYVGYTIYAGIIHKVACHLPFRPSVCPQTDSTTHTHISTLFDSALHAKFSLRIIFLIIQQIKADQHIVMYLYNLNDTRNMYLFPDKHPASYMKLSSILLTV